MTPQPIPLRDVRLRDPLFGHYVEKLYANMIPYQWEALNDRSPTAAKSGCLRNFRIAAGLEQGEFYGMIFQDSDLAKWLEAVAYSLQTRPDPELEARADECVALLQKAQQPDGYLNTYFTLKEPGQRFTNLMEAHELYCAGHFIEAAVAYYEATGKRALLDVMRRYADLIDREFGPGPEQRQGYPGHEEIELALVKLYRVTGEARYLRLASYFIDQRGRQPSYFVAETAARGGRTHFGGNMMDDGGVYLQAHKPPRDQREVVGHAVRAMYLCSAMADLALENGDEGLREACRALFRDVTRRKLYVTGGVGSAADGERFTAAYDLPNDACYCETCASIGLAMFALRMFRLERDAAYADVMELALYNTVLAGVNRDGDRFFYVNPLEVTPAFLEQNLNLRHVKPERQRWFDCACCPTNIARTLGSLGQYALAATDEALYVNLYLACDAALPGGDALRLDTAYPCDGEIRLSYRRSAPGWLCLRVPAHSPLLTLEVNGQPVQPAMERGYARVACAAGDTEVRLLLDVRPRLLYANPRVSADAGCVALAMGPLTYCFEQADNGPDLASLGVNADTAFRRAPNPVDAASDALELDGWEERPAGDALYADCPPERRPRTLRAVPYYCWNNRGVGEMRVWMRR